MNKMPNLEQLAHMARMFRVMAAIHVAKSSEPNAVAQTVFEHFDKKVPLTMCKQIVAEYLVILRREGMLTDDGVLTPEAAKIAKMHAENEEFNR